jgi:hypothetical protein
MKNTRNCSQVGDHAETGCERAYQYLSRIVISQKDERVVIPIMSSLMIYGGEGFTILFDGMVFSPGWH